MVGYERHLLVHCGVALVLFRGWDVLEYRRPELIRRRRGVGRCLIGLALQQSGDSAFCTSVFKNLFLFSQFIDVLSVCVGLMVVVNAGCCSDQIGNQKVLGRVDEAPALSIFLRGGAVCFRWIFARLFIFLFRYSLSQYPCGYLIGH